jgi:hypothetical protein
MAVALFGLYLLLNNVISSKTGELNKILQSYPASQGASIQDPLVDLQIKTSQAVGKVGFAASLIDKRLYFTTKMDELVKTVPDYVRLTLLHYEDNINDQGVSNLSLRLEGILLPTAESGSELSFVNKFVKLLSANKEFMRGFSEVKITSTKKIPYNNAASMQFTLDCVNAKKGGE